MGLSKMDYNIYKEEIEKDPDKIIELLNKKINDELNKESHNPKLLCDYYWILGDAYIKKEEYLKAKESYNNSIKCIKKLKDNQIEKNCRIFIGNYKLSEIYEELQEPKKIIKYKKETLKFIDKNKEILIKGKDFPQDKPEFRQFLTYISLYYKNLEDLILKFHNIINIKSYKKTLLKSWKDALETKQFSLIFEMGFITHLMTLISLLENDEEQFWHWISLSSATSLICRLLSDKNIDQKTIWSKIFSNDLNLGIDKVMKYYDFNKEHHPDMQNKLIDIIFSLNLSNQDLYFLDLFFQFESKFEFNKENYDEYLKLYEQVKNEVSLHEIVRIIYREFLMVLFLENKEYMKAIKTGEENLTSIRNQFNDKNIRQYLMARTYKNLFRIEVKRQNYDEAEKYGIKVMEYYESEGSRRKFDLLLFLIEFGNFYIQQRQKYSFIFDKPKILLTEALEIAKIKRNKNYKIFMKIFRSLAEIDWQWGNYTDALDYYFRYICFYLIYNPLKDEILYGLINIFVKYLENIGFYIPKEEPKFIY